MQTNVKTKDTDIMTHVKDIVVASLYKSPTSDVKGLIKDVFKTLTELEADPVSVPIDWQATIKPDYLVCLEDGVALKFLTRHLKSQYGLTPDEYRKKWGLPKDYPMTAKSYSTKRSEIAKRFKLGVRK